MARGDGIARRKRLDGTTAYHVRLGPERRSATFDTLGEARQAKAQDALRKRRPRLAESCDQFAERWLRDYKRPRQSTNNVNAYGLRAFIAEFRGIRLDNLDRRTAREFALTHRKAAVVARAMFNDAIDEGIVEANPFANLRLEQSRGRRDLEVLSVPELHALADQSLEVHGEYGPHFRAMILFCGYVGLRLGEALALEWGDVDLGEREVHIARSLSPSGELTTPKNHKPRTVLLLDEARDALLSMSRPLEGGRIFLSKRWQPMTHTAHYAIWNPVRSAAGRKMTFHELRHFAGHHFLITLGYDRELVAHQLGHLDGGQLVDTLYGHPYQGALERLKQRTVVPLSEAKETTG